MNLLLSLAMLILAVLAWVFYDKFTKRGAVPLEAAFRSYTAWLAAIGAVFGEYVVSLFAWATQQVDFLQAQFGGLFNHPSLGAFVQVASGVFLLLRLKGQGMPSFQFPDIPDPTDQAGA
ncbi:hypothetical protein QF205_10935 [Luteimonas composti]|uniref:Uncharacterized protein n=1 Tax=Luteimonas composti TaxID=398257 RepID=A0ABT6MSE8_9GAMM|nr:hypothetical protein [Luteimonas composti]MDH7453577.1 hypothetical protein [Luteimonas composti]